MSLNPSKLPSFRPSMGLEGPDGQPLSARIDSLV